MAASELSATKRARHAALRAPYQAFTQHTLG